MHWEMLQNNKTPNEDPYMAQMNRLDDAVIKKNRPDTRGTVIIVYNKLRLHLANIVIVAVQQPLERKCFLI